MGIIFPKQRSAGSKTLITVLVIGLSPLLILAVLIYFSWGLILCIAIWLTWRKPRLLFVYSDSPTWKDYLESEIIPHLKDKAFILNWSERNNWKPSLAVLAFNYFGGYRNFNPIAIVFRPFHFVRTYRFFEAFRQFKYGDPREVEAIKNQLFDNIGSGNAKVLY